MKTQHIISINQLDYGYTKDAKVLKGLDLNVPEGSIYGFLGGNGAGKSTTIRAILGLLSPQSGSIEVFGKNIQKNKQAILQKIGTLIESPSLYKHLNAREILKITCTYLDLPKTRVDHVLKLVNLQNYSGKSTKQYSMGMKQRLGLAIALLSDPKLLILDEPTNGLDPNGIIEIRNIIRELNKNGTTILLSSHLLGEIERIATHVGILKSGKLLFEGSIKELETLKQNQLSVKVVGSDNNKLYDLLKDQYEVGSLPDGLELHLSNRSQLPEVAKFIHKHQIDLYELSPVTHNLEQLFLQLTNQ